MDTLLRILTLIHKELLAVLKDPRSRVVILVPPVMQALLFGYAASYDLDQVPYVLVDLDRSAASRSLVGHLEGSGTFERVADLVRQEDAAAAIDARRAMLIVRIPEHFERDLLGAQRAEVGVIADGRNSNTAGIAASYAAAAVEAFNAEWRPAHGGRAPPLQLVPRTWYNPNLETRWNLVPALVGTLTLLGTLLLTALSVAREREQGTFDQLLVTPFRPGEIMVGKAVPSIMIGLIQATGILILARFWFEIPFAGSYLTLYGGLGVFLMAAVGIGLFVSSLVKTMQQAMLFAFVLVMPFTLLSGLMTPISNMPEALQVATLINPLRYAIELTQRVYLEGAGVARLLPLLWPLALIGAVTLSFSAWFFRHRLT
jgi:ABC-2 type transport system permease protein